MKRFNLAIAAVAAACVVFLSACGGSSADADKTAIEEINKTWLEAIVAKDAGKIAALYAEDGQMMPPNTARAVGREAIEKGWAGFLGMPGMTLTFTTDKIVIAKSGDVAVEIQSYKFTTGEGAAAVSDTGKSTVTWAKRDGKWQVMSDMFSSDLPPPPPPPPAAPEVPAAPAVDGATPAAPGATPAAPATPAPAKPPGQ